MTQWILKTKNLTKHFYLHDQGRAIPSTFSINFELYPGQLLAITGPSGAGKSSLLKCIWRSYIPSSGDILLRCKNDDEETIVNLAQVDDQTMLGLRRTELGFVTQFLHCLPRKSALDVVASPLVNAGVHTNLAHSWAQKLMTRLNVPSYLWEVAPATFSGGEKQRINLARGLIRPSRVLLLDEPTASLDPVSRDRAIDLLRELKLQGTAILAIFHDPSLVDALADGEVHVLPQTHLHSNEVVI